MGGRRYPSDFVLPVNGVIQDLAVDDKGQLMVSAATADQAAVDNNDVVPVSDATNVANGEVNGTAVVVSGSLTEVTLPTTSKLVKSGVKYTGPAITGTYVNGYTLTIVNGAITAIVAS